MSASDPFEHFVETICAIRVHLVEDSTAKGSPPGTPADGRQESPEDKARR